MPATKKRRNSRRLQERVMSAPVGRVDREAGIIRGVRVLGRTSANGREYTEAALRGAVGLYEGCRVYFDHVNPGAFGRSFRDGLGELRNARFQDGAIYADLHYLKSHPSAELVAEAAERMPNRFGLSHSANGRTVRRGGKTIVESIDSVVSVDIVADPATNSGLFESAVAEPRDEASRDAIDQARVKIIKQGVWTEVLRVIDEAPSPEIALKSLRAVISEELLTEGLASLKSALKGSRFDTKQPIDLTEAAASRKIKGKPLRGYPRDQSRVWQQLRGI